MRSNNSYDYIVNPIKYQLSPRTMTEAFGGPEYACAIHTYEKHTSAYRLFAEVVLIICVIAFILFVGYITLDPML
jgi:hypothetical protein